MMILGFSKRHGSNHSCFCRVMGCSQSGAKQEGFEGMSARDCRCWDAESWSSPKNTWKCLALHVIRMIGWLDDFYQILALREGESLILTCDRLCQHKGTTIRHHLWGVEGRCEAQKLWTSLLFISLENAKGFPCDHQTCCPLFWPWFPVRKGHQANFLPWGPLGLRVTIKLDDVGVNLDLISWVTGLIQNIMGHTNF